eukprot:TRINITY_DN8368_c0_g2_i1.p1 TRINITY_DN8368_c0_g2~~TRINITY_DN8368_c0_g2_i1.p1  ORF type:complete len:444 (+),score=52.34 TRINITY_DN8368_c0_g2_i1:566-1897(+)
MGHPQGQPAQCLRQLEGLRPPLRYDGHVGVPPAPLGRPDHAAVARGPEYRMDGCRREPQAYLVAPVPRPRLVPVDLLRAEDRLLLHRHALGRDEVPNPGLRRVHAVSFHADVHLRAAIERSKWGVGGGVRTDREKCTALYDTLAGEHDDGAWGGRTGNLRQEDEGQGGRGPRSANRVHLLEVVESDDGAGHLLRGSSVGVGASHVSGTRSQRGSGAGAGAGAVFFSSVSESDMGRAVSQAAAVRTAVDHTAAVGAGAGAGAVVSAVEAGAGAGAGESAAAGAGAVVSAAAGAGAGESAAAGAGAVVSAAAVLILALLTSGVSTVNEVTTPGDSLIKTTESSEPEAAVVAASAAAAFCLALLAAFFPCPWEGVTTGVTPSARFLSTSSRVRFALAAALSLTRSSRAFSRTSSVLDLWCGPLLLLVVGGRHFSFLFFSFLGGVFG